MGDFAQPLIAPQSVALIGVSGDAKKLSARPLQFCQQHGFAGNIYIVNPRRDEVLGQKAYRSVTAIPEKVDHAYILVGTDLVEVALDDCIAAGVRVVSILADGFAEAGDAGMARQARLVAKAKAADMVLIGPNSMGVVNTNNGFVCTTNAAFKTDELPHGRLAVLSHSGSLIGTLISRGQERNTGFAALISLGNEAQSCVGSLGLELVEDDQIDGFVLFLETMRNPEIFAAFAATAKRLGKPVVAYMLGKSSDGQALSVSHTGAMTGEAEAVRAFLAHHNIAEVSQFDALFEAPALLLKKPQLKSRPRRATIVTTTGGGGAMLVDQLSIRGVNLAGLSPASKMFFKDQQIPFGSGKLVDVTLAGAQYDIMKKAITQLINDPETGIVVVAIGSSAQFNPELAVKPIIDAAKENPAGAPVIAFPLPIAKQSMAMLEANGIPCFGSVESCADSVALLLAAESSAFDDQRDDAIDLKDVQQQLDAVMKAAAIGGDGGVLNEVDGNQIFASLGLKGPRQLFLPLSEIKAQPASASVAKAGLGYPLVAKLVSPDLPHKSDYGAVVLSIETGDALDAAVAQMRKAINSHLPAANIEGLLLQEMAFGLGEALVGLRHDNLVGPIITVGAGGIFAEIYKDVSIRPAPVSLATARKMIDEVKGFAALRGYRGKAKGDLEALANLVANLSQLANLRRIAEAEINPVLVQADGVLMLDALIRIQPQPMLDSAAL
ncbi:acetate--CoA ligase family protein [Alphaproteobacteria bacterium]|nr:acetate--CoA ligase family protein [Alphaproteobacteria bacterium]